MVDWLGGIVGVLTGSAFAPFNPKARVQYAYQGLTGGVGKPLDVAYKGFSGTVGYASLGLPGITTGVKYGLPGVTKEVVTTYVETAEKALDFTKYLPYIIIGVVILVALVLFSKGSDK